VLALDGAGFPCSCEILPGNVSEPGTLEDALARLEVVCGGAAPKTIVIMDVGIATGGEHRVARRPGLRLDLH